jgi:hypothetical protein
LRPRLAIVAAAVLAAALCAAPAGALSRADRSTLQRYAADSWHSFDLLVDTRSGLPDDNVSADGARGGYTSRTNMVMAAAANALSGDRLRSFFARGAIDERVGPLLAMEQFTAG